MRDDTFKLSDFTEPESNDLVESELNDLTEPEELDVQKLVVADLAAEKTMLAEKLNNLMSEYLQLKKKSEDDEKELSTKKAEVFSLKAEVEKAKSEKNALEAQLAALQAKELDLQERNPNSLALLDRDVELPDRFPGETRDHVLEVIVEARATAEKEGRLRRAQILESVLVANEPNGTLAARRQALEKLFNENANIINGPVLDELSRLDIPHKNGEQYLLPEEILRRTY